MGEVGVFTRGKKFMKRFIRKREGRVIEYCI